MKHITKEQAEALNAAVWKANMWLAKTGSDLTLKCETYSEDDNKIGEYELGSVFEKEILIYINPVAIRKYCYEEKQYEPDCDEANVRKQTKATIYHELGHALVEQIVDWMEYLPDADKIFTEDFCQRYDSIINDELDEETLVEDFAWAFVNKKTDPLMACFEELNHIFAQKPKIILK